MDAALRKLADEMEIRALASAYTDACNRRSAEDMAAVYAPNGELHAAQAGRPIVGADALLKTFQWLLAHREYLFQMTHSGLVEVRGDKAVSRWWFSEIKRPKGGGYEFIQGVYQDELARLDVGWRYTRREASGMFQWALPLTDAHTPPPEFLALLAPAQALSA